MPAKSINKSDVRKRYADNIIQKNFLESNDMEYLGLIGDHLIQIADLNLLDIEHGAFTDAYNVYAKMHQDAVDAPKNTNETKDE